MQDREPTNLEALIEKKLDQIIDLLLDIKDRLPEPKAPKKLKKIRVKIRKEL